MERFILALVDILQSVPVLSFQAISVVPFIHLFEGSLFGPECAAVFAIFTSQAWNMILSFYQSLRAVPEDFKDTARMLKLSAWQIFWKIEVPFSIPPLLWNTMISVSTSWFFVVASEAIFVSNQKINLPGIGSYLALAIEKADSLAIFEAIVTMLSVILIYDQLIFRPLVHWSKKFRLQTGVQDEFEATPWVSRLLARAPFWAWMKHRLSYFFGFFVDLVGTRRVDWIPAQTPPLLSKVEITWARDF